MRRNPIYVLKNKTSVGVFDIPLESMVQIIDSDGVGTPSFTQIIAKNGLSTTSTAEDYLNDASNYITLDKDTPSELEKVSLGWRLLGKPTVNYATPGDNAVDLSNSLEVGDFGAKGSTSFATGTGTRAQNLNSVAMGQYNVGLDADTLFEFGVGVSLNPANALEIYNDGTATLPSADDNAKISARGPRAIPTLNYLEERVSAEFPANTTDNLTEGSLNSYYTEVRDTANFNTNLANVGLNELKNVDIVSPANGQVLKYDLTTSTWVVSDDIQGVMSVNGDSTTNVILTTDEVTEGALKYYSEALFGHSMSLVSTKDLAEDTNLYYTSARAQSDADTKIKASPLGNLFDVSATPGNAGDILMYNGSNWGPSPRTAAVDPGNSSAVDVVTLRTDFNNLLSNLRLVGIIA